MKYFLFFVLSVFGYEVTLMKMETQCFGEDITAETLYVGEVRMKDLRSTGTLIISVTDSESNMLHYKSHIKEDKFSFISIISGPHLLCIENLSHLQVLVTLKISTGVAAKDYSNMPSTKDLKESERRMGRITESLKEIHKELNHIKERDTQLTHTNETIQSRIIVYSITSLVMLIGLAVIQVLYLKKYFKSKKMI